LNHENDEDFCRALCILFLPFRNELKDIHMNDVILLVEKNKDSIKEKRSKFEKYLTMIEVLENMENKKEHETLEEEDDDEDEGIGEYIEDETTDAIDRKEFEKLAEKDAKLLLNNYKNDIDMSMDIREFRDLISQLNYQQRKLFDDYVERLCDVSENKVPFYIYIGGEAGTGKSHLARIMLEATKFIGQFSGSELEKPSVLVMAPTGNAAFIVHGKTIESALVMRPQKGQGYVKMSSSIESTLRFTYENVLSAFVDEVSMVGSNKLARINYRVQDIIGKTQFMGEIPLVATGDFGQLPPVGDQMIWKPSTLDGRPGISLNYWNENFRIFYLTEKMRTSDEKFGNVCDKIRKGLIDEEVKAYLESRVVQQEIQSEQSNESFKHGKLSIIVPTNKKREQINQDKLSKLLSNEKLYYASATDRATNFRKVSDPQKQQSKKDESQLSASLLLKKNAPVVITSNHSEAKYRQDGINNGARGYIDSIQRNPDDPTIVEVVWVVFIDTTIGQTLRQDKQKLFNQHKPENKLAVPIEKLKKNSNQDLEIYHSKGHNSLSH
jgi:chromosomal replication initiation ATPase DnaA